jgi:hypothetical protein
MSRDCEPGGHDISKGDQLFDVAGIIWIELGTVIECDEQQAVVVRVANDEPSPMLEKDAASRPTAAEVDAALAGAQTGLARWRSVTGAQCGDNLPVQRTPFIGRYAERAAFQPLLLDPAIRLITLTGPGGAGKTRLAVQLATDLAGHFPGGVCF